MGRREIQTAPLAGASRQARLLRSPARTRRQSIASLRKHLGDFSVSIPQLRRGGIYLARRVSAGNRSGHEISSQPRRGGTVSSSPGPVTKTILPAPQGRHTKRRNSLPPLPSLRAQLRIPIPRAYALGYWSYGRLGGLSARTRTDASARAKQRLRGWEALAAMVSRAQAAQP